MAQATQKRMSRAERREQLLDVTLELIAEGGMKAVSAQAIADAAGVSKPIIYRSYASIYALQLALLRREQRIADEVLDRVVPAEPGDATPRDLLYGAIAGIVEAVAERPATWKLVLFPPEGMPGPVRRLIMRRREVLIERARNLVRWGLPYIDTDDAPDEELLSRLLLAASEEHARILLEDPGRDREELLSSARALLDAVSWR